VTSRRRHRRGKRPDHPEPAAAAKPRTARRAEIHRRAAFEARVARIRRTRSLVGLLGFVPLAAALFPFGPLALIPREIWLGIWAAVFGAFLGLTVRMWRERRAFERAAAAA